MEKLKLPNWNRAKIAHKWVYINKIVKFDFRSLVVKEDHKYKFIGSNKPLISFSSLFKFSNDFRFFGTPNRVLEPARQHGSGLMSVLEEVVNNRLEDISNASGNVEDKKTAEALINWLIDNELKIVAIEKFVTNGNFVGIVDMICRHRPTGTPVVFEIKTRNKFEISEFDIAQLELYYKMLRRPPCYWIMIDKNNKIECFEYVYSEMSRNMYLRYWSPLQWIIYGLHRMDNNIPPRISGINFGGVEEEEEKEDYEERQ